ncbi:MAG: ImcF-related family protein, partial [Chromatiales bacterium]
GMRSAAVLLALVIVGGGYLLFSGSYATNIYLLNQGVSMAKAVTREVNDVNSTVKQRYASIVELVRHTENLQKIDEDIPWIKQVALYRGNEQEVLVDKIVDQSLYRAYWMPVSHEIERQLRSLSLRWQISAEDVREKLRPRYYETLKRYLQLTRPEHFDYDVLLAVSSKVWKGLIFDTDAPAEEDVYYVDLLSRRYLEPRKKRHDMQLPADEKLIAKARQQLHSTPDPDRLYALLLNKGQMQWPEQSVKNFIVGEGQAYLVSKEIMPGLYSAEAWYGFVKSEIASMANSFAHGDWVLEDLSADYRGEGAKQKAESDSHEEPARLSASDEEQGPIERALSADSERSDRKEIVLESDEPASNKPDPSMASKRDELAAYLERELRSRYFEDYAENWVKFLGSLRYKLPKEMADKSRALMYLSSMEGPIAQLSIAIASNTLVYESRPLEKPVAEKQLTEADQIEPDQIEPTIVRPERVAELAEVFGDLQRFSGAGGEGQLSQPVIDYLEALREVYVEVDGLAASVDVKRDSERFAAKLLSGQSSRPSVSKAWAVATSLVNSVKKPTRGIVKSLLSPPVSMAWSGIVSQATSELQKEWKSTVVRPYVKQIMGKFPFSATGSDAALADVAEFYHPKEGILWKFTNDRLSPYLRKTTHGWVPRRWLGVGANFSQEFLEGLTQAQKITDALYTSRDENPNMTFFLQPDPSTSLREMQIESNGQLFRYRNGPQLWQRFDWPGDMDQIGARVMGIADHGRAVAELRADGPWGLFHLLTQAKIERVGGTHYKTSWNLPASDGGTVKVTFNLKADRQDNFFNFKLINSFKLPESLFGYGSSRRVAAY